MSDLALQTEQAPRSPLAAEVARRLMDEHRIFTVVRKFGDTEIVRVTPHLYTKLEDLDALARAIRQCAPPR